jgi:hypothetical protein
MENEDIEVVKKTKLKNIFGVLISAGILIAIAFVLNYYFITLPEQKAKELSQVKSASSKNYLCDRKEPYKMPEEFVRAISLIKQRLGENGFKEAADYIGSYQDCYNIQYGDAQSIEGAEGAFWFDTRISSPDNLQFTINNAYKFNDDLLTSVVIAHEITHALNFVAEQRDNVANTCLENERRAFLFELTFLKSLNTGEKDSILERLVNLRQGNTLNEASKNFFMSLEAIIASLEYSMNTCNSEVKKGNIAKSEFDKCRFNFESEAIKTILAEFDYCGEGLGTENQTPKSPPSINYGSKSTNNSTTNDGLSELEKENKKYIEEQKKQYEAQLKIDKKAYDDAIKSATADYNQAIDTLNTNKTNEINQTISMLSAAGQTSGSEQYQQYISRIVDSYKSQFDNAEKIYQSNLKAIKATKYW